MPDIFDQVAAPSKGDIFDQVAPEQTPEQAAALRLTRGLLSDRGLRPGPPALKMRESIAPKIVRGTTSALPAVGGIAGGMGGTLVGLPAGPATVGTAALGAGVGTATGAEAEQLINNRLFGDLNPASIRGLKNVGEQALVAAGTAGLGAKLAGAPLRMPQPLSTSVDDLRAANAALGVKPDDIRMSAGTSTAGDINANPAKSVMEKTGLSAKELTKMDPFDRAAAIEPHYQQAKAELSRIVDDATTAGKSIDVRGDLLKAAKRFADPQDQTKFIRMVNNVASDLGITAEPTLLGAKSQPLTPRQALDLREALQDRIPDSYAEYRAGMYRAINDNLAKAVPEFTAANQTYSELSAARWANKEAAQKFMRTAPQPGLLAQGASALLRQGLRKALPIGGAIGGGVLSNWAWKKLDPFAP